MKEELPSVRELLYGAFKIYRKRALTLTPVTILAFLPLAFISVPFIYLEFLIETFGGGPYSGLNPLVWLPALISIPILVVSFLLAFWGVMFGILALIFAVSDEDIGIAGAFAGALRRLRSYTWLSLLEDFYVLGGAALYVPAVVFRVLHAFAPFIFIEEGVRGREALARCRYYVEGRWVDVLIRLYAARLAPVLLFVVLLPAAFFTFLFFLLLLMSAFFVLGIPADILLKAAFLIERPVGIILTMVFLWIIFFLPYDMIFTCMLYRKLKVLKEGVREQHAQTGSP